MMREVENRLSRQPFIARQMSGSGSSHFGVCHTARQARRLAARLRAEGIGAAFVTTTEKCHEVPGAASAGRLPLRI
jgi:4-diphosphocytidyl-2C-methyl-D-erythritol kinase